MDAIHDRPVGTTLSPAADGSRRPPSLTGGFCTRAALSWMMAGGIVGGGILVAAVSLSRPVGPLAIRPLATLLFIVGAATGFFHGAVLGYLGRPSETGPGDALAELGSAVLWGVPGALMAWIVAVWIALTSMAAHLQRPGVVLGAAAGWVGGLVLCAWADREGVKALSRAWGRWRGRSVGVVPVVAVFLLLFVLLDVQRPRLWPTDQRINRAGAALIAAGGAVWTGPSLAALVSHALKRSRARG